MAGAKGLGDLEHAVMDHLWDSDQPQTVRQVCNGLRGRRALAYTTVMTVLHRLSTKDLVLQIRDDRAYRYAPAQQRDELVAGLMAQVLDQLVDHDVRHNALMNFLGRFCRPFGRVARASPPGQLVKEFRPRTVVAIKVARPAEKVCHWPWCDELPNPSR